MNFTVLFALIGVCLSRGNQADGVTLISTNCVNNRQHGGLNKTYGLPSVFTVGLSAIKGLNAIGIQEDSSGVLKTDEMFLSIC